MVGDYGYCIDGIADEMTVLSIEKLRDKVRPYASLVNS